MQEWSNLLRILGRPRPSLELNGSFYPDSTLRVLFAYPKPALLVPAARVAKEYPLATVFEPAETLPAQTAPNRLTAGYYYR